MKTMMAFLGCFAALMCFAESGDIALPSPVRVGGKTLMGALNERKTVRNYSSKEISKETLSSLLWAANGVNRPDGRRTAPTGRNVQDIDVYVMLSCGVYLYDAPNNRLQLVNAGDHRESAGPQSFAKTAPVNLFYVQDLARAMKADEMNTIKHGGIHAGAIMQNVYLFCAKEGLGTVARDWLERDKLNEVLKLSPNQRIILGQTVGK